MNYYRVTLTNVSDHDQIRQRIGIGFTEFRYANTIEEVNEIAVSTLISKGKDPKDYKWHVEQVPDPKLYLTGDLLRQQLSRHVVY